MSKFGIGFLGSGPVAQAIHVPFARQFSKDLTIAFFMDIATDLAETLANQHQAKWTIDEDELINDPSVDVVVVGSPNGHHARQILKSCAAGKRLVLAEKPLAVSRAELKEIRSAAMASETQIVVGTMHAYDEAFLSALDFWKSLGSKVHTVEVNCYLPTNDEMIDYATQLIKPDPSVAATAGGTPPSVKDLLTGGVLGLAMHDIPGIREFVSGDIKLRTVNYVAPWGYLLEGQSEEVLIRMIGQMPGAWRADWSMTVFADNAIMKIQFQPSYVDSGSALVTVSNKGEERIFHSSTSPYTSEWQEIVSVLRKTKAPRFDLDRISSDLEFALSIIHQFDYLGL